MKRLAFVVTALVGGSAGIVGAVDNPIIDGNCIWLGETPGGSDIWNCCGEGTGGPMQFPNGEWGCAGAGPGDAPTPGAPPTGGDGGGDGNGPIGPGPQPPPCPPTGPIIVGPAPTYLTGGPPNCTPPKPPKKPKCADCQNKYNAAIKSQEARLKNCTNAWAQDVARQKCDAGIFNGGWGLKQLKDLPMNKWKVQICNPIPGSPKPVCVSDYLPMVKSCLNSWFAPVPQTNTSYPPIADSDFTWSAGVPGWAGLGGTTDELKKLFGLDDNDSSQPGKSITELQGGQSLLDKCNQFLAPKTDGAYKDFEKCSAAAKDPIKTKNGGVCPLQPYYPQ